MERLIERVCGLDVHKSASLRRPWRDTTGVRGCPTSDGISLTLKRS